MADQFFNQKTSVTESDFAQFMAMVFAFLVNPEVEAQDKSRVINRAGALQDECIKKIEKTLFEEEEVLSYEYLVEAGIAYIPLDMVRGVGEVRVGDALAAVDQAIHIRRVLDARAKLDKLYTALDSDETTVNKMLGELSFVTASLSAQREAVLRDPVDIYEEREKMEPGIQFFVDKIDGMTLGCPPGKVATIAAWTSHGKSTYAKNMAYLNAKHNGVVGVYYTQEETVEDVLMSFVVRHSMHEKWSGRPPLENTRVLTASLNDENKEFYKEVSRDWVYGKEVADIHICGIENLGGVYTVPSVVSLIKSYKPYKAVYIDYMNIFKTFNIPEVGRDGGDNAKINYATIMLRNEICLDKEPVPLVQCAQIGRKGFNRLKAEEENQRQPGVDPAGYLLSDLSEANELEKGSAYVVTLYLNSDCRHYGNIKFQLLKSRLGGVIEVPFDVTFTPQHYCIGSATEEVSQQESFNAAESAASISTSLSDLM